MRSEFPEIGKEFLRGNTANSVDTGYITAESTAKESKAGLRGVEMNTARGVKVAPVIEGITTMVYGPNTDAPVVDYFKVYGEL